MITEDYVSFETSKLLKEKGFDGHSIITTYDKDAANAYINELKEKHLPYSSDDPKLKEFYYTMPTLQMAMKWLREVHELHIAPHIQTHEYYGNIYNLNGELLLGFTGESPEEACETAIKYCLKYLI